MPQASIIVPWWDHGELLSLWERNVIHLRDAQIIFIDNGSGEQTRHWLEMFAKRHPITLIRNETNRGFAAANNQGAAIATGAHLIFFNNDLRIFAPPVAYLCERAGSGLAGPGPKLQDLYESYLEGWSLCINKAAFEQLGGWPLDYGLGYWEDVDLCYRARSAELPVTAIPDINRFLVHLGNQTSFDGRIDQPALHFQNRARFVRKFHLVHPKFVIDSIGFEYDASGVSGIWRSLLSHFLTHDLATNVVILVRHDNAPRTAGLRHRFAYRIAGPQYTDDAQLIQDACDEEQADLFVSSGHTAAPTTPSAYLTAQPIPPDGVESLRRCVAIPADTPQRMAQSMLDLIAARQ
jgi:GT2 family glycosyltransferase